MLKAKFKDSNGENIVMQEEGEKFQDFALRVWYKMNKVRLWGRKRADIFDSTGLEVGYVKYHEETYKIKTGKERRLKIPGDRICDRYYPDEVYDCSCGAWVFRNTPCYEVTLIQNGEEIKGDIYCQECLPKRRDYQYV